MAKLDEIVARLASSLGRDQESVSDLLAMAEAVGLSGSKLQTDICLLLRQRIAFWLLGSDTPSQNFAQRKRLVDRRVRSALDAYGAQPEAIASLVATIALAQGRVQSATDARKLGINTLEESSLTQIFLRQNYRCAVCGVPLLGSVRKPCGAFRDGLEPLANAELEHVTPYYLFGNEGDYELLCAPCNSLKNDRLGVQEDGFVLAGNHIRRRDVDSIRRRVAFWTLYGARRCQQPDCSRAAGDSVLFVQPSVNRLFAYGTLAVRCSEHAAPSALYLHETQEVDEGANGGAAA